MNNIRLLIDANHLAYRNWAVSGHLCNSAGYKTGTIFGVLKSLKLLCDTYKPSSLVMCIDVGRSFRKSILETYKGSRGPSNETEQAELDDRNEQFAATWSAMETLGIPVVGYESVEADDLCAIIAKKLPMPEGGKTIVVSGDKDLLQLVDENTWYYHTGSDKLVTMTGYRKSPGDDFIRMYSRSKEVHVDAFTEKAEGIDGGVPFDRWVLYRSLVGDTSDELSGIRNVGPSTADRIVKVCATIEEVLQKKDSIKLPDRVKAELTEDNMRLQYSLIDLNLIINSPACSELLDFVTSKVAPSKADIAVFKQLLINWEMKSIMIDVRGFLSNFPLVY